jgi:hypothetical protein
MAGKFDNKKKFWFWLMVVFIVFSTLALLIAAIVVATL